MKSYDEVQETLALLEAKVTDLRLKESMGTSTPQEQKKLQLLCSLIELYNDELNHIIARQLKNE